MTEYSLSCSILCQGSMDKKEVGQNNEISVVWHPPDDKPKINYYSHHVPEMPLLPFKLISLSSTNI